MTATALTILAVAAGVVGLAVVVGYFLLVGKYERRSRRSH